MPRRVRRQPEASLLRPEARPPRHVLAADPRATGHAPRATRSSACPRTEVGARAGAAGPRARGLPLGAVPRGRARRGRGCALQRAFAESG